MGVRVTRNFMGGMMNRKMSSVLNGNTSDKTTQKNSLLQSALSRTGRSRSSRNKRTNKNGQDSRIKALTSNITGSANSERLYYNMKYHAGQVCEYAEKLSDQSKKSLFKKAEENGSTAEVVAAVKGFVSQYNSMLGNIEESGTRTDKNYQTMLNNLSRSNSAALATCGVIRQADGTLSVDDEKLESADLETLKKIWSGSSSFAARAASWANSVENVAERNMKAEASSPYSNLFNQYGSSGNYYNFRR